MPRKKGRERVNSFKIDREKEGRRERGREGERERGRERDENLSLY